MSGPYNPMKEKAYDYCEGFRDGCVCALSFMNFKGDLTETKKLIEEVVKGCGERLRAMEKKQEGEL